MTVSANNSPRERDSALLVAVAAGDRRAREELYLGYHRRLSRFLARFTQRYENIEEIINDAFMVVWQSAKDFRNASQVSTWIIGIAYRTALKSLQRHKNHNAACSLNDCPEQTVDPTSDIEIHDWLEHGLNRLPLEQRLTLELACHLGHSLEEIAVITECPMGTVKARLFHAREKLRESLPSLSGAALNLAKDSQEHAEITELIPWYVNGTLKQRDRCRVDAHLILCAACRDDLALERRVFEGVTAESSIEYMPVASLNRLGARLDSVHTETVGTAAVAMPRRRRRGLPWQGVMAASVALTAVAVVLLAADRWLQVHARSAAPKVHTVTTNALRHRDEAIRAVFTPTITLVELQAILDESQLRIVAGPTEAGVYSLALTTGRPVNESLALLRQHSTVRFAESTRADLQP